MQNKLDPRWQETADALAIPLEDLLTVASYETGGTMDPLQRGPTTQWGQHAGLIQFGEPQAKKYGVDFTNAQTAMDSQLGADGAIVNYMLDHGFVPNQHSGMDIYSTINAGGPNLYNRSDANNGGAAGTVADKWNYQMGGHRQNAAQMMGGTYNPPASSRSKRRMAKDGSNMMQQQKQPQGLLGRLTNRSESTGLNLMESFAAGLDPLIMPSMRGGDAIRERGDKRVKQGDKNSTIQYLSAQPNGAAYVQMIEAGMPAAQALAKFQGNVEQNRRSEMTGAASNGVQSSKMLPDGSGVMSISRDGSVTVRTAGNEILSGDAAVKFVQDAQANYVANERDIYGGRAEGTLGANIELGGQSTATTEAAKQQIKMAGAAIEDLTAVNAGIANIDSAISAIDSGAQSGILEKYLPAIGTSTASLRNSMNRMGLDVIGSVTFGALSAAEMNLAMETAVPRNLNPMQLRKWLSEKKRVQGLAADALSNAANYLSNPQNTLSGYLEQNSTGGGQGSSAVGSGTQRLRYDPETGEMVPVK